MLYINLTFSTPQRCVQEDLGIGLCLALVSPPVSVASGGTFCDIRSASDTFSQPPSATTKTASHPWWAQTMWTVTAVFVLAYCCLLSSLEANLLTEGLHFKPKLAMVLFSSFPSTAFSLWCWTANTQLVYFPKRTLKATGPPTSCRALFPQSTAKLHFGWP